MFPIGIKIYLDVYCVKYYNTFSFSSFIVYSSGRKKTDNQKAIFNKK